MQMQTGLHGKLEELGLDEILQIVGVSRRTGILTLKSRGREAVLHLREGLLVRASSTGFRQSLGELLVNKGAVTAEMVRQGLLIQQQQGFQQHIGTILHRQFNVDLLVIEQTVREQISNVLMTLFAWAEGTFDFSAGEVEIVDGAYLDPVQLILELSSSGGDNALVAAGVRMQHELGADEGAEPVPEAAAAAKPTSPLPSLVMVDDDAALNKAVAEALQSRCTVQTFTHSEDALVQIDALYRGGDRPLVVVDLIMPKMDGTGVLGGQELVQLLLRNFSELPIVVVSEFPYEEAIAELLSQGCSYLDKPRRGETGGECFTRFIQKLKTVCRLHD